MGRKKLPLEKRENKIERQVTYSKRSYGLLKKAYELAVLCGVDVALITFSPSGRLRCFSTQERIEKVLQRLIQNIPNMPANERFQVSQDVINLIDTMAGEDDVGDLQSLYEAKKEEILEGIVHGEAVDDLMKRLLIPYNTEEEKECFMKFLEYALSAVTKRKEQLIASQLGSQFHITNPSLSTQIPIQQLQAGNEVGISDAPPQEGMQLQLQGVRFVGMGDPASSMQQIGSGQAYCAPGTNPSSSVQVHNFPPHMQSANWHIPIQQQQGGTDVEMSDPLQGKEHLQAIAVPEVGSGDPTSSSSVHWHIPMQQQQARTEAGMWYPPQGGEQSRLLGNPFSSSSSVQTSMSDQVRSEVRGLYGSSNYMWDPLVGRHEMPSFGAQQPSSSSRLPLGGGLYGSWNYMWGPLVGGHEMSSSGAEQPSSSSQFPLGGGLYGSSNYMWGPLVGGHEMPFSGAEQPSSSSWRPLGGELYGSSNYLSGPLVGRHEMPSSGAQQPSSSSWRPLGGELYGSSNYLSGPLVSRHEMPSSGAQQPSSSSWRPLGGELYGSSNYLSGPLVGGHDMPSSGAQQPSSSSWRPLGGELYGSSNYLSGPLVGGHEMPSSGAQQPSSSSRYPLGGDDGSIEDPEQASD